jgi:hypothetical protein
MKLMLRGLLALGVAAVVALTASAESGVPQLLPSKTTPPAPTVTPAATVTAGGGCATCGDGSAHRVLKGRLFRRGDGAIAYGASGGLAARTEGLGARADRVAEGYIHFNERLGNAFERLAGPPVDGAPAGPGSGGGKHKGGPNTQPGTLVFPQHPFVRSPRDFFMMEQP